MNIPNHILLNIANTQQQTPQSIVQCRIFTFVILSVVNSMLDQTCHNPTHIMDYKCPCLR